MSSARYAPLPNAHTDPHAQNEMEAAFLDSDDEDDEVHTPQQTRGRNGYQSLASVEPEDHPLSQRYEVPAPTTPSHTRSRSTGAPADGTYDFENVDYDADWTLRPPPGAPPSPTDALRTFRESQGNSNGLVPDFSDAARQFSQRFGQQQRRAGGWLRSVVPEGVARRLGMAGESSSGPVVGGGLNNDGVFANVTAKPSRAVRIQEGDNVYLVPEESQKDAPPSYASAQADAVPPYWETTINIPSASTAPGDMVVDALPTGSLFSFLWNMLVSISFQFVGFLLTYLLHTTHAAKLGSRAGLGVTLIQYGFAMRSRAEEWNREGVSGDNMDNIDGWPFASPEPTPTFETAAEAEEYYRNFNGTLPNSGPIIPPSNVLGDATTEWLSFFLMTVGWFILLTSLLSFWRVKRWERGILSTSPSSSLPAPASSSPNTPPSRLTLFNRVNILRTGLGFPVSDYPGASSASSATRGTESTDSSRRPLFGDDLFAVEEREDGELEEVAGRDPRGAYVIPIDETNPERTHRLARAYADEVRLQRDLRAAGLL
ncbi:hypothetical protein BC629DRAFT_1739861 [Irpex lacteus]|nr:hypothetical protein BC629DRAFT_1739861 [Irpex lacteus]